MAEAEEAIEFAKLELERTRIDRDFELRVLELEASNKHLALDEKNARTESRSKLMGVSIPLIVAIVAGAAGYLGTLQQQAAQLDVERERNKAQLILKAIDPTSVEKSVGNLKFLAEVGLLDDPKGTIAAAAKEHKPTVTESTFPPIATDQKLAPGISAADRNTMPSNLSGSSAKGISLLQAAVQELGVMEHATNTSPRIDAYLKLLGIPKGTPWCGAFMSWCLSQIPNEKPIRSGSVEVIYRKGLEMGWQKVDRPVPGDIAFIKTGSMNDGRFHHGGFVFEVDEDTVVLIEGNVNSPDEPNSPDAVYKRRRKLGNGDAGGGRPIVFLHIP